MCGQGVCGTVSSVDGSNVDGSNVDEHRAWAPPAPLIGICWALAATAVGWTIISDDPAGRVLTAIAALALAGYGAFGTFARPRLSADRHGIRVRGLAGSTDWTWEQLKVELVITRRLGRNVAMLELEERPELVGHDQPRMLVLGWLDLGTDPRDVAEALDELRADAA
ncbi:MAG: PH domain-containing protein [Pseudonocardiaceae bacterium]|nr:PH domain-containing protein [Pseudonocardiaceae bacterium]